MVLERQADDGAPHRRFGNRSHIKGNRRVGYFVGRKLRKSVSKRQSDIRNTVIGLETIHFFEIRTICRIYYLLHPPYIMLRQALRSNVFRVLGTTGAVLAIAEVTTHAPSQGRSSAVYHRLTDQVVTPLLRKTLNPEQAHDLAIGLAALGPHHCPSEVEAKVDMKQELWKGRIFPNPIGLAAGFDKDGKAIQALLNVGFGFVEIGSVTLQPQPGNPSPRMFRLVPDQAIINRYGFNSLGVETVHKNLRTLRQQQQDSKAGNISLWERLFGRSTPNGGMTGLVGVNLGKNKTSETPLEDYQTLIRELGPDSDYLVINVSSPNTPGLRDLQESSSLEYLLKGCLEARNRLAQEQKTQSPPPLLVKLAPDLGDRDLRQICQVLAKVKVDGIILTNTTTARPESLQSPNKVETGGLSGRPLGPRSTECIRQVYQLTDGQIPIIGVGGIFTAQDVYEKLKAGASVVQIYSGMVYAGPGMVSRLRHELAEMLLRDGYENIQQVVGLDHHSNQQRAAVRADPSS